MDGGPEVFRVGCRNLDCTLRTMSRQGWALGGNMFVGNGMERGRKRATGVPRGNARRGAVKLTRATTGDVTIGQRWSWWGEAKAEKDVAWRTGARTAPPGSGLDNPVQTTPHFQTMSRSRIHWRLRTGISAARCRPSSRSADAPRQALYQGSTGRGTPLDLVCSSMVTMLDQEWRRCRSARLLTFWRGGEDGC